MGRRRFDKEMGQRGDMDLVTTDAEGRTVLIPGEVTKGVIAGVELANRRLGLDAVTKVYKQQADRIAHFRQRVVDLGLTSAKVVIVLLCVDDRAGAELADALMPGTDWNAIRATGQVPYARGLAGRAGIMEALDCIDMVAASKLRKAQGLAVVVVDAGVADVFEVGT